MQARTVVSTYASDWLTFHLELMEVSEFQGMSKMEFPFPAFVKTCITVGIYTQSYDENIA